MKNQISIAAAVAIGLSLISCQTAATPPTSASASGHSAALRAVAGTWTFSHAGPSPLASTGVDLVSEANDKMKGTRIFIQADGNAAMVALGQSGSFKVEVLEETPLYIRLGSPKQAREEAWTYDKSSKQLAFPMKVTQSGSSGYMSAFFKR